MKEISYFNRDLFLKGRLIICIRTQFEADSLIQELPSLIDNEIDFSEYNLRMLESNLNNHHFSYVRFERGHTSARFCTGCRIETARLHGCDFCVSWSSIKCSLLSQSLEEFLKDFW